MIHIVIDTVNMTIPFKIKTIHTIYNTYIHIYKDIQYYNKPKLHKLTAKSPCIKYPNCVAFMNDYEGQFVSEWRAFILQQGNKFRRQRLKASSADAYTI